MTPRSRIGQTNVFDFLRLALRFGFAVAAICATLGVNALWGQASWQSVGASIIAATSGTSVGIGTTTPSYSLDVQGGDVNVGSGQFYRYNGVPIAYGQTALLNYFRGSAGNLTMTGYFNTASGAYALANITTGNLNTALGVLAASASTTGALNTAIGYQALHSNNTGSRNVAIGSGVAANILVSGSSNILIGGSSAVDTPAANTSNFLNIGNTLFATGVNTGTLAAPAGKVGIGTASPSYTLDVQGGQVNSSGGYCINGANCITAWPSGGTGSGITSLTVGTGLTGGTITTSGTVALDLTRANTWTGAQTFGGGNGIWNASGNVGIGTTAPASLLHLSTSADPEIRVTAAGGSGVAQWPRLTLLTDTSDWEVAAGSSATGRAGQAYVYDRTHGRIVTVWDASGNMGIGTTAPAGTLDVNGPIYQSVGTSADSIHSASRRVTKSIGQLTLGNDATGESAFVGMKTQVFAGQGTESPNQADIEFFTWGERLRRVERGDAHQELRQRRHRSHQPRASAASRWDHRRN